VKVFLQSNRFPVHQLRNMFLRELLMFVFWELASHISCSKPHHHI
jgi:hypothetical protein